MPQTRPPPAQPGAGRHYNLAEAMEIAARQHAQGRLREAETILRRILDAVPAHPGALHLLGIIAHQSGQTDTAVRLVTEAIGHNGEVGLYHTNLCEILRQAGRLEEAVAHGRRGAELDPRAAVAHSNLGVACYDAEDFDAAEAAQRRALAIDPHLPQALNNLGSICRKQDDREQAMACYREALAAAPEHAEALNNLGALLTEDERPEEARAHLLRAVQVDPAYPEAHRNIGNSFLQEENFDQAAIAFEQALKHRPDFVEALTGLATVRRETGAHEAAKQLLERALELEPDSASTLAQLGMLHGDMGFPDQALAAYDRALAADPEHEQAHVAKGHLLIELGDMAGAEATLAQAHARDPASIAPQLAMVQLRKVQPGDPVLSALEQELARLGPHAVTRRMPTLFALAKCYDDAGEHARAIEAYLEGCALKRARVSYSAEENTREIEAIMETFDDAAIARLSGAGDDSDLPIFVLGMPRSGTTLTEQIIASHSQVHGAGELPDMPHVAACSPLTGEEVGFPLAFANVMPRELAAVGARYAAGLRERDPDARHITDKMPANFLFIGLIRVALPRARIVHVRRNPVDTCLSGLTKLFKRGQNHSYDLVEQGRYYVDYARLMDHWRTVLPAGSFHELRYEDLVADTEQHARALLDYCGLDWEPQCLEFHKTERSIRTASVTQVRQPIYKTSVQRWRRYEHALGPLLEVLGDLADT